MCPIQVIFRILNTEYHVNKIVKIVLTEMIQLKVLYNVSMKQEMKCVVTDYAEYQIS